MQINSRWEDPENRVARQFQDQAQDPTFSKRSAEYGNTIKFMSDNQLYELGKDGSPNWPLPPKPFQKGLCADGNRYQFFLPSGSPPPSLPPSPPGSPPPELVDFNQLPDVLVTRYMNDFKYGLRFRMCMRELELCFYRTLTRLRAARGGGSIMNFLD